jgi:hypothetical protein
MDSIDDVYGRELPGGSFSRQMHFFSLFVYLYDKMYGLGSDLERRSPKSIGRALTSCIGEVDRRFKDGRLPPEVLEAVSGAATDLGRRRTRLSFFTSICDDEAR